MHVHVYEMLPPDGNTGEGWCTSLPHLAAEIFAVMAERRSRTLMSECVSFKVATNTPDENWHRAIFKGSFGLVHLTDDKRVYMTHAEWVSTPYAACTAEKPECVTGDPRKVGGWYYCGYWQQAYEVLAIDGLWVTIRWRDGRESTNLTPFDPTRDFVLS